MKNSLNIVANVEAIDNGVMMFGSINDRRVNEYSPGSREFMQKISDHVHEFLYEHVRTNDRDISKFKFELKIERVEVK